MVLDAEARLAQLLKDDPELAAEWERDQKLTVDPRVTPFGHFLRRTSLDEIPQLINVVRGEMSLVGPRPVTAPEIVRYGPSAEAYLSVRPGLTDPASVKYRHEADILGASADPEREYVEHILPDKIALAREYIARATLLGDLGILVRTLLRIAS